MKLITAIINHDDSSKTLSKLTKAGFHVAKIASTGGFLLDGNTTIIIATKDELVDAAIKIIKKYACKRNEYVAPIGNIADTMTVPIPVEVTLGGATIFVQNIEQFMKV